MTPCFRLMQFLVDAARMRSHSGFNRRSNFRHATLVLAISGLAAGAAAQTKYENQGVDPGFELTFAQPSSSETLDEVGTTENALARGIFAPATRLQARRRYVLFEEIPPSAFRLDEVAGPAAADGIVPEGLGLDLGSDARPYVVKYACCDDTELYAQPTYSSRVIDPMGIGTEVWVFDILGAGLPGGISSCSSLPAPCPHLWAEVFSNDLGRSGFVPLTALFDRPIIGEVGQTTFEVSFDRINRALAATLRDELIRPADCSPPGNRIVLTPSHGDRFLALGSNQPQSCQFLIGNPVVRSLVSCNGIETSEPIFANCIFANQAECDDGTRPNRSPSTNLSMCAVSNRTGSGTCSDCREWYQTTGQWASGWRTQAQLVDQCLPAVIADDANNCSGNECVQYCENWASTEMAVACGRYIGPADTKWFGDPEDYECGELPIGRTHPGYSQSTVELDAEIGEPDQNSKQLATFSLPNPKVGPGSGAPLSDLHVSMSMGRLGAQRPVAFSMPDLTSRGTRNETSPSALDPIQFWFALSPESKAVQVDGATRTLDVLEVRVCGFLQGNRIDLGQVRFNQNEDGLFPVVREIDFGAVDFDEIGVCGTVNVFVDPTISDVSAQDVQIDGFEITGLEIEDVRVSDIDISPGPASVGAALTPLVDVLVGSVLRHQEQLTTFFGDLDTPAERRLIDWAMNEFGAYIEAEIAPKIEDALNNALDDARAGVTRSLSSVCDVISPPAPRSHLFHYFYRYLDWNCAGIAGDVEQVEEAGNLIRPFLSNPASAEQGCYSRPNFFTPADAGRRSWWTAYSGQEWYWSGFPDSGCRIASEIASRPDRAVWRSLRCATFVFNAWFNLGPTPPGSTLAAMVASTCQAHGENALRDLYGTNEDLEELYRIVHPPDPNMPIGELQTR